MKRILITGKTSWIGNELERRLAAFNDEYEVTRVSLRDAAWKNDSWEKYDSIVHAAAISHDGEGTAETMRDINVSLTYDVAAKAKADSVGHLIFLSSFHVYASDANGNVVVEKDTLPSPTTAYGKSKFAAEKAIKPLADDQFSIAILRPPLVYGPYCTQRNFPRLVKLATTTPCFPNVRNRRSMLYSQSLAELMRLLIDEQRGGLFLPQNRKHVCTADMLSSIGKHLGHRVRMSNFWAKPATFLASHNQVFRKMFGDAYYELDASDCGFDYHVGTFDESIEDSVASVKTNQTDRGCPIIRDTTSSTPY